MLAEFITAADVTLQMISWGAKASERAVALQVPVVDISTAVADTNYGVDDDIVLNAEQYDEIRVFLADPAVVALLRLAFIRLIGPNEDAQVLSELSGREAFEAMADHWCEERSQTWSNLGGAVWDVVNREQQLLLAHLTQNGVFSDKARDLLVHRFFYGKLAVDSVPDFIRRLDAIAHDGVRQERLRDFLQECERLTSLLKNDSFLVQGIEGEHASFDDLYIDRTLVDAVTGEALSASSQLDVRAGNPRVVVVGNPGVGKTTLTSWAKWQLQSDSSSGTQPLSVTIISRHSLVSGVTILEALKAQMEQDYQCAVDGMLLEDLLSLGWIFLVVDGIDEILDAAHRASVVEQLHTFAERYPCVSIVCTTRRAGFEVSLFQTSVFRMVHLEEYTDAQVAEYATKWFGRFENELRAGRFLGESRGLNELRRNPLMLALLCTLFRQYDFIPRSRRDVYLRCASLMFHEWDPRRGIAIPNLFKSEGEAILRNIALLLYTSGGIQQSVEGGQLEHLISTYLVGRGEEPVTATAAARELLEYCSVRAWILSKSGGRQTVATFSFTHRTFFEFFTAEGLVRKLNRENALDTAPRARQESNQQSYLGSLAREIFDAYVADTASVLPELLLQAADDLMDGVSVVVLQELLREAGRPNANSRQITTLAIRLVASAGIPPEIADRVFSELILQWTNPSTKLDLDQFKSTLDVGSAHRNRLVERLAIAPEVHAPYLARYARLAFLGEAGLFADEWKAAAVDASRRVLEGKQMKDPLSIWYAHEQGILDLDSAILATPARSLLRLAFEKHDGPGLIWRSIADSDDPKRRRKTWQVVTRNLTGSQVLEEAVNEHQAPFIEEAPGLRSGNAFPEPLALFLALATGGECDFVIDKITQCRGTEYLATLVRRVRAELDGMKISSGGRWPGDSYEKFVAARRRLNRSLSAEYRAMRATPCPRWVLDFAGVRETTETEDDDVT